MALDLVALLLFAVACYKGFSKGLIVAVFSLIALVLGAAAAIKLSGMAARYLVERMPGLGKWTPAISFLLVFMAVVVAVRLTAGLLEKTVEWSMLGWVNKAGGILFFALLYFFLFSIFLFYANQLGLLSETLKEESACYSVMQPMAPWIMDQIGKLIPIFRQGFNDLERFFDSIAPASSNRPA